MNKGGDPYYVICTNLETGEKITLPSVNKASKYFNTYQHKIKTRCLTGKSLLFNNIHWNIQYGEKHKLIHIVKFD